MTTAWFGTWYGAALKEEGHIREGRKLMMVSEDHDTNTNNHHQFV